MSWSPTSRSRMQRTVADEIAAIVDKKVGALPASNTRVLRSTVVYGDQLTSRQRVEDISNVFCPVLAKSADYVLTGDDFFIEGTGGGAGITITLPTAVGITGRLYCIKKVDAGAGAVTVDGDGAETIDGAATHALAGQYDVVMLISNGTNWWVI